MSNHAHELDIFLDINSIPEIKQELDTYKDEILSAQHPTSHACMIISMREKENKEEYLETLRQTAIAEWLYSNNEMINHSQYF